LSLGRPSLEQLASPGLDLQKIITHYFTHFG